MDGRLAIPRKRQQPCDFVGGLVGYHILECALGPATTAFCAGEQSQLEGLAIDPLVSYL